MTPTITETKRFAVAALSGLQPAGEARHGRVRLPVRVALQLGAFGANAFRAVEDGARVIGDHAEDGVGSGGHEELYVVLDGHATFTVDGKEIDAPPGTCVAVQPGVRRSATARSAGTSVLAIGAPRGEAYVPSAGERVGAMFPHYEAGDYATAISILAEAIAERPHPLLYYNLACCEALMGRGDEALGHLEQALAGDARLRDNARDDADFETVRDASRFRAALDDPAAR